jgi:hypothetical protein
MVTLNQQRRSDARRHEHFRQPCCFQSTGIVDTLKELEKESTLRKEELVAK